MRTVRFLAFICCIIAYRGDIFAQDFTDGIIEDGEILARVIENGELVCGVNGQLPRFSQANDTTLGYSGFDVDICRAVAAAILGDADAVLFVPVIADARESTIENGDIDLIVRNTTWNYERDITWEATFGPVVFYDAQAVVVRRALGVESIVGLNNLTICVAPGTTTIDNIRREVPDAIFFSGDPSEDPDEADLFQTFIQQDSPCDAFTSDRSQILAQLSTLPEAERGTYLILDDRISEEPLAPVSNQGDQQFADIVRVVVFGLITADYLDVNQNTVTGYTRAETQDEQVRRLLGFDDDPNIEDDSIGEKFSLRPDFMVNVIIQIGSYGDIYNRHIEDILPRDQTLNRLWVDGGQIYAPPWR